MAKCWKTNEFFQPFGTSWETVTQLYSSCITFSLNHNCNDLNENTNLEHHNHKTHCI